MRLLLDTHLVIWATTQSSRLSSVARLMGDPENELLFSPVKLWEVAIKRSVQLTSSSGAGGQRILAQLQA